MVELFNKRSDIMPGLKPTQFELKMQEDRLIDKTGKIISGAFKNCNFYLIDKGLDKNGNLMIEVGPFMNIFDDYCIKFTIPKEKIHSYMHTKNLTELTILQTACQQIAEPIEKYIVAKASDFTQEIYKGENLDVFQEDTKDSLEIRRKNAIKYYTEGNFEVPEKVYAQLNAAPEEFLKSDHVLSLIGQHYFAFLNKEVNRFDTPEALISFRAVANKTILDLMDIFYDKQLSEGAKIFENGFIAFENQFETQKEKI